MTVRVTSLRGAEAGAYYVDPERRTLATYYLDSGEPPGAWAGRQAAAWQLCGEVDASTFLALVDGRDSVGSQLGRRYGDESVRAYDVTFSAPKSVSLLWALGDETVSDAAVSAHDDAVAAVLNFVDRHATTRATIAGAVHHVDAEGLAIATFRQHTSRLLDPQLHTHAVAAAKVRSTDGRWLALDAAMIKHDQQTLSALYHSSLRSELSRRLGVRWESPVNGIAEIEGLPQALLEAFSQRSRQVEQRLSQKLDRFQASYGREPSTSEAWRLEREAVLDSRPNKPAVGESLGLRGEWRARAEELGCDLHGTIADVIGKVPSPGSLTVDLQTAVGDQAIAALTESASTWRPNHVLREVARAMPTTVALSADDLVPVLERLSDQILAGRCVDLTPEGGTVLRHSDGHPTTESLLDRRYTTMSILLEEHEIFDWADERWARAGRRARLSAPSLDLMQHRAATLAAGTDPLVVVIGPAGAGKTSTLRTAVDHLRMQGRSAFGVAPSAAAAEVLSEETGMASDTVDKLLADFNKPTGLPDPRFLLAPSTTLFVDEASMLSTPKFAQLTRLADRLDWRVVLVGDPLQFSAVGRGGMFQFLVDAAPEAGPLVRLDHVHRFHEPWEAEASLALRRGDPSVLDVYDHRGRIRRAATVASAERQVIDRWCELRTEGKEVVLLAATNETATSLNAAAQRRRLTTGEVSASSHDVTLGDGLRVLVGDEVQTRVNDRTLRTDAGVTVKNRQRWEVEEISPDGSLAVSSRDHGRVILPPHYVESSVTLAYASTAMAAQGRTVDQALLVVDGPIDAAGLYVPMTRGRERNDVWVVLDPTSSADAIAVLSDALSRRWADEPALTHLPVATEVAFAADEGVGFDL